MHHLHRVFDGNNVLFRGGYLFQGRIEGSRLAAAGRPGHQNDAVRGGDKGIKDLTIPLGQGQIIQILKDHIGVEDPHHRLFTEGNGHGGDPDLNLFLAADTQLDPAILGPALFRDIHPGQRLDPGGNGCMHHLGQLVDRMQHAVNAESDHAGIPFRFDMDIAGLLVKGVMKEMIDRRLDVLIRRGDLFGGRDLDELLQITNVDRTTHARAGKLALCRPDRLLKTKKFGLNLFNIRLGGQRGPNRDLIGLLNIGKHCFIIRMIDGDIKDAVLQIKGEQQMGHGKIFGDTPGDHLHVEGQRIKFFKGQPAIAGHGLHDGLRIQHQPFPAAYFQLEGVDNIDKIGVVFICSSAIIISSFQQLEPLLPLLQGYPLPLPAGEQLLPFEEVKETVTVQ